MSDRRNLLGGLLALGAAGGAGTAHGASLAALGPAAGDAALLALHAELQVHRAAEVSAVHAHSEAEGALFADPGDAALVDAERQADARINAAFKAWESTAFAMVELPATTLVGALVKALVLADGIDNGATVAAGRLADSVRADAIRLGLMPGEPSPSPDEALIVACAQHPAIVAAYNAAEGDDDLLWDAYEVNRDAIGAAEPQTMAGMLAKARAAKVEALAPDGTERPQNCPAEAWAWDLANDMLRLYGGAA